MHVVLVHFNLCKKTRRGVFRGAREEEAMGDERALAGMPSFSLPSSQRWTLSCRRGRADGGTSWSRAVWAWRIWRERVKSEQKANYLEGLELCPSMLPQTRTCRSGTPGMAPAPGGPRRGLHREWWHCLDVFFRVCIFEWTCSLRHSERTGILLARFPPIARPGVPLKAPVTVRKPFWNYSRNGSLPSAAGALTVRVRPPRWLVTTF